MGAMSTQRGGSKLVRAGLVCAGLLVLGLIVVVGLGLARKAELPPPLWTEADLPPVPAADANAWTLVAGRAPSGELQVALDELPPIYRDEGEGWDAQELARLWTELEDGAFPRRRVMARAESVELIALLDSARARPHFVLRCESYDCQVIDWHSLHGFAIAHALNLALDEQQHEALAFGLDLLRLDQAHSEGASSWLSLVLSLRHLDETLQLLELLVQQPGAEPSQAQLSGLAQAVGELELDSPALEPAVIGEYLVLMAMFEEALGEQPEGGATRNMGLDLVRTRELIDERFELRHAGALAGDVRAAVGVGEPPVKDGPLWWLSNPTGKTMVETMIYFNENMAESIETDLAALREQRELVLALPAIVAANEASH